MTLGAMRVTELYHITERPVWEAASVAGEYRMSTRGVALDEQGFIHLSLRHQLRAVAEFVYGDADDLVVLVIDSTRVTAPVRYEAPEPGAQPYPHLYGPLSTDAVIAVLPVGRDETGKMLLPGNGATATLTGADRTRQVPEEGDVRERQ